jgi:hypothetical protein
MPKSRQNTTLKFRPRRFESSSNPIFGLRKQTAVLLKYTNPYRTEWKELNPMIPSVE